MPMPERQRRGNRLEEIRAEAVDLARRAKLDSWSDFVRPLNIPREFAPAVMSGRFELIEICAAQVADREWDASERKSMIKLVAGLLETNMALQEHAQGLSSLVTSWGQQFAGLEALGRQIETFADFGHKAIVRDAEDENPVAETVTAYDRTAIAIAKGEAHGHALWVLLFDEHDRNGYALKPIVWEGAGEYQHVSFTDGRDGFIRIPDGKRDLKITKVAG